MMYFRIADNTIMKGLQSTSIPWADRPPEDRIAAV